MSNFKDVRLFTSVLNNSTFISTSFQISLYFHFPAESLAANLHFSLMKQKEHLDIWEALRLSKSPGVDPGKLLFWARSVIWAFCQLILTCIWHQRQFVSTEYHLGILSIGSDVYLMSRTICEHGVLFGHFCQLIWHVSTIEGQFVNAECYLDISPIDLTCVMSGTVCVGQVFIWSSSWGTCDSSVFWCVSIYSICVTGVIAVFCKTGTTRSIH